MGLPAYYSGDERFPLRFDVPISDLNRVPPRSAVTYTANRVAVLDDVGRVNEMNLAGANTYTIPLNATVPFPIETVLYVRQVGAGQTTIQVEVGVTLHSLGAADGARAISGQWGMVSIQKRGTNEWVMDGAMA